jgi:hypothetical protein
MGSDCRPFVGPRGMTNVRGPRREPSDCDGGALIVRRRHLKLLEAPAGVADADPFRPRLADKDDLLEDLYLTIRELVEHHGMTARGVGQCVTRALNQKPQ